MSKKAGRSFGSDFRQFFVRGIVTLLPAVLTLWILVQAYRFVDQNIAQPLNSLSRFVVIKTIPVMYRDEDKYPTWYRVSPKAIEDEREDMDNAQLEVPERDAPIVHRIRAQRLTKIWQDYVPLQFFGLVVAVCLFYLAGRIFGGLIGRRLTTRFEVLIARIPGFKQVYPHVKQIVDFVFGDRKLEFNRVALVEYPRRGMWSIGLVTGRPPTQWTSTAGDDLVTLFIPSSPTPFTGYTIAVPKSDVKEIDVTVEEALRFTVSGGVVIPENRVRELLATTDQGVKKIDSDSESAHGSKSGS